MRKVEVGGVAPPAKVITIADPGSTSRGPHLGGECRALPYLSALSDWGGATSGSTASQILFVAEFESEKCGWGCSAKKREISYPAVSQNYPTMMHDNEKINVHFF